MASLLDRKLLVLTGKGGVGKTTVSAALGLLAANRGLRTIVVEVGAQQRLPELFGAAKQDAGRELELRKNLWSISIDPDRALLEWLQALGGRVSGRVLASSGTFQYFGGYDLVILDAPATGHALGMLHSPQTFGAIARVGPIASQTQRVRELLSDPARTSYLAIAQPTEMAVTETLELQDGLQQKLDRTLHAVVLNGTLPRRFSAAELLQIDRLKVSSPVMHSAALAAHAVHDRARSQHNQLARLRRRRFEVLPVPFIFTAELDLTAIELIAGHLSKRI